MDIMTISIVVGAVLGVILIGGVLLSLLFRTIVKTDQVHIVQSGKDTISYGKGQAAGNVYYKWPSSWPKIGLVVKIMQVSNFDLSLDNYPAYDQDRVPFKVDIAAFFRIEDTNKAAQRVESIEELREQLKSIVQGAVRTILAAHSIDEIMTQRDTFGTSFTQQVEEGLKSWGVVPVKNLELMDIRDADESKVIENIMAKKKSFIEMESRQQVAENNQNAELKEIEAEREVEIQRQQKEQAIGQRTAEKEQAVGIADEEAQQKIKEAQAVTAEKDMAVQRVNDVRSAEIAVEVATQNKEAAVIDAAATLAEGNAQAAVRKAIFEADNALELKLTLQKETAIGVAEALASSGVDLVPKTVIGGGGADGNTSTNATETLTQLMTVLVANSSQLMDTTEKVKEAISEPKASASSSAE
jgi:flotillin